ncbi:unnamed protein product [Adineta steineri]|uniref:Uncharacterized protein n=1 Tax=Adineta steineri TaxID=433720 RepID=A0A815H0B7_9BILA|nr:unnamed protein product [Adineta steineri]
MRRGLWCLSNNRPKLCQNASWNASAITIAPQSVIGTYPASVFVNINNHIYAASLANNIAAPPSNPVLPISTLKPTDPPKPIQGSTPPGPVDGDDSHSSLNLIGPIIGAVAGILVSVLISVFIICLYLKRKARKTPVISKTPDVKFIEYPSLYTGAISTADSTARLYGMSPTRNNSITSHYYEKINYNEQS